MVDEIRFLFLRSTLVVLIWSATISLASAQDRPPDAPSAGPNTAQPSSPERSSPWVIAPIASSSPKLGTAAGGLGAYGPKFDAASRLSLFGGTFQYSSTDSIVSAVFARTSFGEDHHRVTALAAFGYIKNDYEDYLGTGQPLHTDDDLKAVFGRYLYRIHGNLFVGAQANAANYQVLGASAEDDLFLETLGVRGFKSAGVGAIFMHDSRDGEDMPTKGWFANLNNIAYREGLGGSASYDAYRADLRAFWTHGSGHVFAVRQFNWFTHDAPVTGQSTVVLRGYKLGEYLAPYMSSLEAEERYSFNRRWGATLFFGTAALYGTSATTTDAKTLYPSWGGGGHFVIKPDKRLLVNLEYAGGIEGNHGIYLKFGYAW
jgi:hypothetical protein